MTVFDTQRRTIRHCAFVWLMLVAFSSAAQIVVPEDRIDTQTARQAPKPIDISPPQGNKEPVPFGLNLFNGGFKSEREDGLNPDYVIQPGDRINIKIWGATSVADVAVVDAQGNIFIPEVGPIRVAGIRNAELTSHIGRAVRTVFTQNVHIYTNLQNTQPTVVLVTGYVKHPGGYAGLASDSVLFYLGRAGGIIAEQGSFRNIVIKRNNKIVSRVDLYAFLLQGNLPRLQFRDGDTIVVGSRGMTVTAEGEAKNTFLFEFEKPRILGAELIGLAGPQPFASHATVTGSRASGRTAAYVTIAKLASLPLENGDRVVFEADQQDDSMLVRVEGSHLGPSRFVVPKNATLLELLDFIEVDRELADTQSISIRRTSLARRQAKALDDSLKRLETAVIGASSQTSEESQIRVQEAKLVVDFVARARGVKPEGVLVVAQNGSIADVPLEPDDVITIPARSETVLVSGEVMVPQAIVYSPDYTLEKYIHKVGGFTQRADRSRILVVHRTGEVVVSKDVALRQGDEVLVLPKVPVKNLQVAKTIAQIIFQIALSAATALNVID